MKRLYKGILILLVLGIVIFIAIRANSFSIALIRAGLNSKDVQVLDRSFDSNEDEFKVIKTSSKEQEIILARVTKNSIGFWTISQIRGDISSNPNLSSIAWLKGGGAKRFTPTENAVFENEWHYVYYGNNAIKLIEFIPGQLPENVTVNIQQAGNKFWIHIVSFAEPDVLNGMDVKSILEKNKCISIN